MLVLVKPLSEFLSGLLLVFPKLAEQSRIDGVFLNDGVVLPKTDRLHLANEKSSCPTRDILHGGIIGARLNDLKHLLPPGIERINTATALSDGLSEHIRFDDLGNISNPLHEFGVKFPSSECAARNTNLVSNLLIRQFVLGKQNRRSLGAFCPLKFCDIL